VWISITATSPGCSRPLMTPRPAVTLAPALLYQVSLIVSRAIGPAEAFRTVILVMTMSPFFSGLGSTHSRAASPRIGGVSFLPARTDVIGGAAGFVVVV